VFVFYVLDCCYFLIILNKSNDLHLHRSVDKLVACLDSTERFVIYELHSTWQPIKIEVRALRH
jgi:hypothetical protein